MFAEPSAGPADTCGYTLDDIMGKVPAKDDTYGAGVADVLTGKTFWGLTSGAWGLLTGTAVSARVPRTGQTTCYDSNGKTVPCTGTGQDGDKNKGVALLSPRFTINKTVGGTDDGTVTDNLTGLI